MDGLAGDSTGSLPSSQANNAFLEGQKVYSPEPTPRLGFIEACHFQECLGWQEFLEVCISILWQEVQNRYFQWLGLQQLGQR